MDIFGAIGAINALLLALFLVKEKNRTVSDKILIAWVLNFFLYFGCYFLFERFTNKISIIWLPIWGISLLAHPVFLFLYSISLSKKGFVFDLKIASNFLVILFWVVSMIPFMLTTSEEQLKLIYTRQSISYELFLPMMVQLCIELFYFIKALIVLIKHQNIINQEFSYHDKINLNWLRILIYFYIVILISNVVGYSLVSSKILNIKVMDDLLMIVRMLVIYYMFYHGYKQKLIYTANRRNKKQKADRIDNVQPVSSQTEQTKLPASEYHEIIEKLRKLMVDEKMYLEPELSLGETANKLGIHAHRLSKLLNVQLSKNFFEFVNEYRVDEFKRLAIDPENKHISLLGLAIDAGFNSKATFNRFFKKSTGLTPSEFRKSNTH